MFTYNTKQKVKKKTVPSMSPVAIAFGFVYHPTLPLHPKTHKHNRTGERMELVLMLKLKVLKHPKATATEFDVVCYTIAFVYRQRYTSDVCRYRSLSYSRLCYYLRYFLFTYDYVERANSISFCYKAD